jgi:hypothetical protein
LNFRKSRAGGPVQVGDDLGNLVFAGYDSSSVAQNSIFMHAVVSAVAAGSVTSYLEVTNGNFRINGGDLGVTGARINKGWFTDIEATNAPTIGGNAIPKMRFSALGADATANSTTTGVEIGNLQITATGTGTFVFQYTIRYQSGATTTGIKLGVNHTGTAAVFMANMRYASTGGAAATAAATQAGAVATGNLHESFSTRTKSTTAPNLGPTVSVDTANADMLVIVEGLIIVTAGGDLELWHASEVAASSQIMKGSSCVLTQVA